MRHEATPSRCSKYDCMSAAGAIRLKLVVRPRFNEPIKWLSTGGGGYEQIGINSSSEN
jgi:hypothetical protein